MQNPAVFFNQFLVVGRDSSEQRLKSAVRVLVVLSIQYPEFPESRAALELK